MLKSGENGLIGPGSNNYGKDDKPKEMMKSSNGYANLLNRVQFLSGEMERMTEEMQEQEHIIRGLEEGSEQWKAKYENLLVQVEGVAKKFSELQMNGAHNCLIVAINTVKQTP